MKRLNLTFLNTTKRHYLRVAAFVVFGISLGVLLYPKVYPYFSDRSVVVNNPSALESTSTPDGLSRSAPVRLRIPTLNLDTTFEAPLGLNADLTVSVPKSYEKVGWYKFGPTPGEVGPAVVLGHVDSVDGAAVFYELGQLTPGDQIFVQRQDGTEAVFEVDFLERYPQEEFPSGLVYGEVPYSALRLVTCTGSFDKGEQRYSHNLVVYAKLVEQTQATNI